MGKEKKGYQVSKVYKELKRRIITLEFQPGEILDEKRLMSELRVGRTPIREALLMLKNENLVVSLPNRSAYVKELTLMDTKDLTESLMGIEKLITSLAVQRVTPDALEEINRAEEELEEAVRKKDYLEIESQNRSFHQLIAKASKNRYLFNIYENLRSEVERLNYVALSKDFEDSPSLDNHHTNMINHHREFIDCLARRDVDRVEKLATEHIKLLQNRITLYITKYFNE